MVYRVLADGIDIYGSDTESSLLSPSLETELNSAGSLEFTLPPDHPSYDDISLMQTEIEVYEDDDLIFFGRPAEVGIDWNKQKKVVCEGALAYLNDAAIRPHKFEGALISDVFKYIIAQYNAQVAQNKQFIVGNITIVDRYVYTEFDYDICLSVLISTCIDSTGGYLFLRKEEAGIYIDWLAEVPDASDQPVQFASNMLDLNQDTRAEDICTVVLPVGGQVDGANITIAPVNQGSDILEDSDAIAKYGRILKIQQWNDIVDPQALKDKATEWLAKQQEDDITIETDAAELHYLDGSVGAYRIGQLVNVLSGPHGVDKEYPILKMSMNLDSGTKKITLGTPPRKELTELSGITNSTGGGSSSGGGGGGGSTGVTDVIVNGSSVVSDHVARISAVTPQQLNDGLATKANQSDLNALSTVVAGKASQADLNALSTAVAAKQDQLTPGTGISIDANNVISATGGGTEVEANPSEPATDDLETIKIGDKVYDIPGSGGSSTNYGKFTCDVLFDTPASTTSWNSPIEICDENVAKEYDMLNIMHYSNSSYPNQTVSNIILVKDIGYESNGNYNVFFRTNNNMSNIDGTIFATFNNGKLYVYTNPNKYIAVKKVYGLKFENKLINRSDIYSEEERMIGRWTDGKPLYQKTYRNISITNNADNVIDSNFGTDKNICTHNIEFRGISGNYRSDYNNSVNDTLYSNNGQLIYYFYKTGNWSQLFDTLDVTIQYTKTTDTPGSGFLPEDPQMVMMSDYYSEDEQVVGRWTDGKPLYQKTVIVSSGSLSSGTMNVPTTGITNVEKCIDWSCRLHSNSENRDFPIPYDRITYSESIQCLVHVLADHTINCTLHSGDRSSYNNIGDICITFKYTKTTDAPGTGPTKGNLIYLPALYSEEEREVGVWTDGKPLYQKTFVGNINLETSTWTELGSVTNVEELVFIKGTVDYGTGVTEEPYIRGRYYSGKVYYYTNQLVPGTGHGNITIQYTKTTDQPGSGTWTPEGQLAHHYSTSEKIVGTWIDGSTVYERTWDLGSDAVIGTNWTGISSIITSDWTGIIEAKGMWVHPNAHYYPFMAAYNAGYLELKSLEGSSTIRYITLQYTKSS